MEVKEKMGEHEVKKCACCQAEMDDYKTQTFRIGGMGGEWSFLLGDIADVEEQPLPVHLYICPECGKIDLFAHEQTKKILLGRRGLKECRGCGKKIPLASEICPYCGTQQK
jgi:ribosomal protein L32